MRNVKRARRQNSQVGRSSAVLVHRKNLSLWPLTFMILGVIPAVQAETQPPLEHSQVKELAPITVTATLTEQEARLAPASITIIDRQNIEARSGIDLRDAIVGETGVSFTQAGGSGRKAITLRGMAGHHVLTLVDGWRIPASDSVFGHADYQYSWLPMVAMDRIEIIRGPMSTLYGSDALGGVVNMITRKPSDEWKASMAVKGASTATGGSETAAGSASFYMAGPVNESLGLRVIGETAKQNATPNPDKPQYSELEGRKLNMGGLAAYLALTPNQTLEVGHEQGTENRNYFAEGSGRKTDPLLFENHYKVNRKTTYMDWKGGFDNWDAGFHAHRSVIDVTNSRSNGAKATLPQALKENVLSAYASRVVGNHFITLGSDWREETLENTDLKGGRASAKHRSLFVQDEIELPNDLNLTAGLRYDKHEIFGTELSPRLYLTWEAKPNLIIKGGYGHAFRAPTLKQSTSTYAGVQGIYTFIGNSELKPETLDSYELAMDWQLEKFDVSLTAFHSKARDLIVNTQINKIGIREIFQANNVQRARLSGLEAGITWYVSPEFSWVNNFSLLRTKDLDDGTELEYRPRSTFNSRLDWNGPQGWSAQVGVNYTGSQYRKDTSRLPSYAVWNASIAKQLNKNYNLRIGVNNIGNTRLAKKSPNFRHVERGRLIYLNLLADF